MIAFPAKEKAIYATLDISLRDILTRYIKFSVLMVLDEGKGFIISSQALVQWIVHIRGRSICADHNLQILYSQNHFKGNNPLYHDEKRNR